MFDDDEFFEPFCEPIGCYTCGGPLPIVRPTDEHCSQKCVDVEQLAADQAADNMVIEMGY